MELKNAVAVCLISMFSATRVLLIARSLDNQAAARYPHGQRRACQDGRRSEEDLETSRPSLGPGG